VAIADVLMITYNRPQYLRLALPHLLETCRQADARVWLWHNGDDEETLSIVRDSLGHPAVHRFHHSHENMRLTAPTNWVWTEGTCRYVSKVDDDCMPDAGWIETIAAAHDANPSFGVVGTWRFPDEDFRPELAAKKIRTFAGSHQLMCNLYVQGSGYLLKRELVERHGPLRENQSFPMYCKQLARHGAVNGWYFPFIHEEHMDDPRSPFTCLKSDADIAKWLPLSAKRNGVTTVDQWLAQQRQSAYLAQAASLDVRHMTGWRRWALAAQRRLRPKAGWGGRGRAA
jgi:glycosyltransferase involved in cell wall biosynthesis